jgi:hypothetical protein
MPDIDTSPASAPDPTTTNTNAPDAQTPPDQASQQPSATSGNPSTTPTPGADQTDQPQPGQNPQQQPGQQPQPGQKQLDLSKAPQGQPTQAQVQQQQQQAQVQKAGHMYQVLQALTGGPQYKTTIDPNTGDATRTEVPVSKTRMGFALALEAMTGALTGLAQTGPGAVGKAGAAGVEQGQQIAQQRQQAQQQQNEQAQQDYARHAQVFQNNLRMLQIAQTVGQKDFDQNSEVAAQYKPLADQIQKDYPTQVLGVGPESDAAKYHSTKNSAIPTGRVIPTFDPKTGQQATGPAGNKLWQQEYMFVDPSFKGDNLLTADDKKAGEKYGVVPKGLPDNITTSLSMALNYKHRIVAAGLGDQDVQGFYKTLGQDAPNYADMVKQDPTLIDAMEKFQPLLNATQGNYEHAIGELAQGDGKNRPGDPQAAGKILNLYGGTKNVQAVDQNTADTKEKAKKEADKQATYSVIDTQAKADAVLADPKGFNGEQVAAAQQFNKQATHSAGSRSYTESANREQAEIDTKKRNGIPITGTSNSVKDMVKDPNVVGIGLDPNEKNLTDGTNTTYLNNLRTANPNLASLIEQIGTGQQMLSAYGLAKNDGQVLGSLVARAYPGYQFDKAQDFQKMHQSFTSGKDATQIESANTTYRHLSSLFDHAGSAVLLPGTGAKADYDTDADKALEEIHAAYTPGVQHQEQYDRAAKNVHSPFPWVRQEAVREMTNLLSDKSGEKQNTYRRGKPTSKLPDFEIISPDAQASFQHVTGKQIGTNGYTAGSLSGQPNNSTQPQLLSGQRQGEQPVVHNGMVVGYTKQGASGMRPVTPFQQQQQH